ncbi:hypothetical protein [[Acholeplasma] multilocale]|uniref:hypothetical protein n=1 Tax=[Acholeplasma] multilocale TaxID=264638 RepID=UPI00047AF4AF|nr:hypothetical protein [[Acholeplasma] multilocale]
MNGQKLSMYIKQLKQIITILKTGEQDEEKLKDLIQVLIKIIDETVLEDSIITYWLEKNQQKSNRVLEMKIRNFDKTILDMSLVHNFLYLLKTTGAILLTKYKAFDFYIYTEVNTMLNFYIKSSIDSGMYDVTDTKFNINDIEYHLQNQMFKYIYSFFDKITYINHFIIKKYELESLKEAREYKFINDFVKISSPLFKTRAAMVRMQKYVEKLYKSQSFHYVRKLRNNLEHSFTNPERDYSVSLEIELLFILIFRTILQLKSDFKTDNEMFRIFKQRKD